MEIWCWNHLNLRVLSDRSSWGQAWLSQQPFLCWFSGFLKDLLPGQHNGSHLDLHTFPFSQVKSKDVPCSAQSLQCHSDGIFGIL